MGQDLMLNGKNMLIWKLGAAVGSMQLVAEKDPLMYAHLVIFK